MKTSYLCHITDKTGKKYSQKIIEGILELKAFLRSNRIHFQNEELSHLNDRAVRYRNPFGYTYEVEVLADTDARTVNGNRFLAINSYCKKYNHCRQTVYNAINSGRIRSIRLGYSQFVEDIPLPKTQKKQKKANNDEN